MSDSTRKLVLGAVLLGVLAAIVFLRYGKVSPVSVAGTAVELSAATNVKKESLYKKAREITNPSGFLNTTNDAPITVGEYVGKKVVMIDFWTYSCINCQRTLPYLNAWYDKYRDKGLEIISIHTPEFEFEKDKANVAKAAAKFGVQYPIVQDNDYGTWQAYNNRYWPRKFIIDIDGDIVYDHIGEGGYDETEMKIKELLKEREERLGTAIDIDTEIVRPLNAIDISRVGSPETYFGYERNEYLGNGEAGKDGEMVFSRPKDLQMNKLYLEGKWDVRSEYAKNREPAKIIYTFKAKNVYLVAASGGSGTTATILLDGKPVGHNAGSDVHDGKVLFTGHQLYHLVSLPDGADTHTLEIVIGAPGIEAYAFTFG